MVLDTLMSPMYLPFRVYNTQKTWYIHPTLHKGSLNSERSMSSPELKLQYEAEAAMEAGSEVLPHPEAHVLPKQNLQGCLREGMCLSERLMRPGSWMEMWNRDSEER